MQVISAANPDWIFPFTGLQPAQFRTLVRLVAERGGEGVADGRPGRQWARDLADRVLLVATYWRTNLTMRQIGPLFGVSHSAAHRVIDTIGPLLALAGAQTAGRAGRDRRRDADPHPRSPSDGPEQELPVLDEPAGRMEQMTGPSGNWIADRHPFDPGRPCTLIRTSRGAAG